MRKNLIALSVATLVGSLGMVATANANVLRDTSAVSPTDATITTYSVGGRGHQLFLPYFNVQNGNATLLNLINTDVTNAKAVKVRFRGGSNSDDVFDFQLYMSPGDVWAAQLSRGADGRTVLTTTDKSCTIPAAVGKDAGGPNSAFVTARLPGTLTGDALARETREGYVEVFNMADIPPKAIDTATGAALAVANPLFTAVKHVAGVAPCTPATMAILAANPVTVDGAAGAWAMGLRAPSSGLFGNWAIVNVPKAGTATGEFSTLVAKPNALSNVAGRGNIVFFPQTGDPAPTPDLYTSDPSLRTIAGVNAGDVSNGAAGPYAGGALPIVQASMFDLPDISTPYLLLAAYPPVYTDPVNYITALQISSFETFEVMNEYLTDTNINAFTDWTFSQITRRYGVAPDYRALPALGRAFTVMAAGPFYPYYSAANTSVSGFQICVNTQGVIFWDREENTAIGTSFVISPNPPVPQFRLCGETSVLTFNSTGPSVLGAEIARTNFSTGSFRDGWARVGFQGAGGPVWGIPVVGKSFVNASTGSTAGSLNVGGSWEHRYRNFDNP